MTNFAKLEINGWRQFESIDLEFHPKLTVLTGANGSGKTTILNILNRHYGWNQQFVATPEKDKTDGILKYVSARWNMLFGKKRDEQQNIGVITYTDSSKSVLKVPINTGAVYHLELAGMKTMEGLHIPSHRPIFTYQNFGSLPVQPPTRQNIMNNHKNQIMSSYQGGGTQIVSQLKQALVSMALFGEGNQYVLKNQSLLDLFVGFQEVLKKLLPPELGFESLLIEMPEVLLKSKSGTFPIDALSGGLASLVCSVPPKRTQFQVGKSHLSDPVEGFLIPATRPT